MDGGRRQVHGHARFNRSRGGDSGRCFASDWVGVLEEEEEQERREEKGQEMSRVRDCQNSKDDVAW